MDSPKRNGMCRALWLSWDMYYIKHFKISAETLGGGLQSWAWLLFVWSLHCSFYSVFTARLYWWAPWWYFYIHTVKCKTYTFANYIKNQVINYFAKISSYSTTFKVFLWQTQHLLKVNLHSALLSALDVHEMSPSSADIGIIWYMVASNTVRSIKSE